MTLSSGRRLGAYEVVESIGAGGMGEVYHARDTKLGRDVAIKVLPESFASDDARLARFEREARLLASLNHPRIATLHGFEEHDSLRFLVMELVPGETLAERLRRGPMPLDEVLAVASQIADGLQAAHEKNIVHRDLKPANVKMTPEGNIKLLDFGLGKTFGDDRPGSEVSESPTAMYAATGVGLILGTASYMSPEQARGKAVDARTDVWAFGCVLWEALTGRKTFDGDTATDIIAAVVKLEPDWNALPADTPASVRKVLKRCLQKDPVQRFHSIADARLELEEAPTVVTTAPMATATRLPLALAFVAGALLTAVVWWGTRRALPPAEPVRLTLSIPGSDAVRYPQVAPVISPDGRHVVYAASRGPARPQLFLRSLDRFGATPIPGTEGVDASPFFSPDAEWLAFFADGRLMKLPLAGGVPVTLTQIPGFAGGAWGDDGTIVLGTSEGSLLRLPDSGGATELLLDAGPDDLKSSPFLLRGSREVLFSSYAETGRNIEVARLDTGERRTLVKGGISINPHYVDTGHIVYQARTSLVALPFDVGRLEALGPAVPVLDGIRLTGLDRGQFSVSRDGTLLTVPLTSLSLPNGRLVWVDREGKVEPLGDDRRAFVPHPRLSPDGRRVAVGIGDFSGGASDVWLLDVGRESLSRITFDEGAFSLRPFWSRDGATLFFSSNRNGPLFHLFSQNADGSGEPAMLDEGPYRILTSVSSDGNVAIFRQQSDIAGVNRNVGMFRLDEDDEPVLLLDSPYNEHSGTLSPDDRFLAYVSDESGREEIYVRGFPDLGQRTPISTDGGTEPLWSRDGKELFYRNGDRMMAVPVLSSSPTLDVGRPVLLFQGRFQSGDFGGNPGTNYDVAPDGRFLMIQEEGASAETSFQIVLNWGEELKRLAPVRP
ncbi:MAG TPA: protein kinase [Vicinamibacteria bacterium]|nr:protein kinase [Vicinamibacteria bacterium]